jgi:cytochrome c553
VGYNPRRIASGPGKGPALPPKPRLSRENMARTTFLLATAAVALAFPAYGDGDAAAGRQKNFQCMGCHGIPGWKTAFPEVYPVPRLGGQHAAYIVSALRQYKSGERDHLTMRSIATNLSDQDMEDLAAYYSQAAGSATVAGK